MSLVAMTLPYYLHCGNLFGEGGETKNHPYYEVYILNITGYRIFYGNHENVYICGSNLSLNIIKDAVGGMVSIRSEADQLASELVTMVN